MTHKFAYLGSFKYEIFDTYIRIVSAEYYGDVAKQSWYEYLVSLQ